MKGLFLAIWYSLTFRLIGLFIILNTVGLGLYLALSIVPNSESLTSYPVPFLTYIKEQVMLLDDKESIDQLMGDTLYDLRIEYANHSVLQTDLTIPSLDNMSLSEHISNSVDYYIDTNGAQYLVMHQDVANFIFVYRYGRYSRANIYQGLKVFIPITALLFIFSVYFVFFRFFRPLSWIRQSATRIGSGELGYRIPYQRNDELGQLVDIINQMAEDLEQLFDSKRHLLLAISHELRTPLTRMKLNIALLDDNSASKRLHRDVSDMIAIVGNILESEKLEGQHQALIKTPVKLSDLLNELKSQYELPELEVCSSNSEDEPTLLLDVTRIRLLISNLIQNAIKYTDAKDRYISIVHKVEKRNSIIDVKDNGKGISKEHARHIFSAFYRTENARERETGGVGLGLYLCRNIALAHKGELSLLDTGASDKGSCFRLVLPNKE